jgi:hypothetical protein
MVMMGNMYASSSYSSLVEDPVLEPPGGASLLHARALASQPAWEDARPAPGVEADWTVESAQEVVAATDPRLFAAPRPPSAYECARCGWYPARRIQIAYFVGLLLSVAVRREIQALCRPCAVRRHLGAQTRTYLLGFLGIGMLFAPFFLLRNGINRLLLFRLPKPYFRAPEVVTKRTEPASFLGTLPVRLLCWVGPLAAVMVVAYIISEVAMTSS